MRYRSIAAPFMRIVIAVCLIVALAAGLFVWNEMDWYPIKVLAWHAKHGNVACVGDFNVPVSTWVSPSPEYPLSMNLKFGEFGSLKAEIRQKITPGIKWKEAMEAKSKSTDPRIAAISKHFLAMQTVRLMIADQPSFCIEDVHTVRCIPETQERGLTVDFFGSPALKPLFYQTLSKITRSATN